MTTLPISSQESLLSETNPASLDELFNRDPLHLAEADLAVICKYFRDKREQWHVEEVASKSKPKGQPKIAAPKLSLDDLKKLTLEGK